MIQKTYDTMFDVASSGRPYMVYPKMFADNRGTFSEVLAKEELSNIQQINRSTSCQWTVRGCHAQKAPHCQSKLVEALNLPIYDVITDARPDSKTFGLTEAYLLDPNKQNKLFVPHGFLHAFVVPPYEDNPAAHAFFMYYCDDVYSKEDEVGVNPTSILPKFIEERSKCMSNDNNDLQLLMKMFETSEKLVLSEKDTKAKDYQEFMEDISSKYAKSKQLWYI